MRRLVAGGQLKAGDKLPSVRELAQSLTINPMTVSKAFSLLDAEALLALQPGRVVAEQHRRIRSIAARMGLLRPSLEGAARESRELRLPRRLVVNTFKTILGERQS